MFVGRDHSVGEVVDRLRDAAAGRPGVVLVQGPPGIGKTALVHHALSLVEGLLIVDAVADEAETDVAWGVLDQLARAISDDAADELASMVSVADASAVGAWLLRHLDALEGDGPVAVVVDDIPWADRLSVTALLFALRRLRSDRVVALLTARSHDLDALPQGLHQLLRGPHGTVVHLGGLDRRELTELFDAHGISVPDTAAQRLVEQTDGNPLHLTAFVSELPADVLTSPASNRPLPAPASFRSLVLGRLGGCRDDTRRLVEAAVTLGTRWPLRELAEVAEVPDPLRALDEAVRRDLLEEQPHAGPGHLIGTSHPMVRSAVYNDLGPLRRTELHRRIAEVSTDRWTRLRHLVEAAEGPQDELVAELEDFAAERAGSGPGATADAAAAYRMAASLCGERRRREDLVLRSLECLMGIGDAVGVAELDDEIQGYADTARRRYVQGSLLAITSGTAAGIGAAIELLESAWDGLEDESDPSLRAGIATQLATILLNRLHFPDVDVWARRAIDSGGVPLLSEPYMAAALSRAGIGHPEDALGLIPPPMADGLDPFAIQRAFAAGVSALWSDDPMTARRELLVAYETARSYGVFFAATLSLVYLSDAEYRLGRFDDAIRHAELAASTAEDADQLWFRSLAHGNAALALAASGDLDAAQDHVEVARTGGFTPAYVLWAEYAGVLTHLAAGRTDAARSAAATLEADPSHSMGVVSVKPWQLAAAEAHLAAGDADAADRVLAPAVDEVAQQVRPVLAVGVARIQGRIHAARDDTDAALTSLRQAVAAGATCPAPFEVAHAHLDLGAQLRRSNERREAAQQLRAAVAILTELGAATLLEVADRELAACGLTPVARDDAPERRLTPQERAVAVLASRGLRNKEIAAELVVSVKTVEYHLGNVFPKLGISNRAQLAGVLPEAGGQPLAGAG